MPTPCLCTNRTLCKLNLHLQESRVSVQDMDAFERGRRKRIFKRGEKIFEQGAEASGLYCLQSGYVLLKHVDRFGNETAFRVVAPGELMGHRSFFANNPHAATAQALCRTYVCFHPRTVINRLLDSSVKLARCFLGELAQDPGPADTLKLRNLKLPLRIRLVYLLAILHQHAGVTSRDGSVTFNLPLKRLDIAALIGARPESVTRVIKDLENDGIAIFNDHEVTVPHLDQLLDIVGGSLRQMPDGGVNGSDSGDTDANSSIRRKSG